ncbi:unnamed protein product, partial [Prorocentrum cordatum]
MCRHLYDPIRTEKQHGRRPAWIRKLRELQGKLDEGARSPHRSKSCGSSAASAAKRVVVEDVAYDADKQIALRWRSGGKAPDVTDKIFEKPGCAFCWALWDDGYEAVLDTLSVSAWKGQQAAAEGQRGSASKSEALFSGTTTDGIKVVVVRKLLDPGNPGMVIKLNGSQKLQMAFKTLPEEECTEWMATVAGQLCHGSMTIDDAKEAKKLKEDERRQNVLKRPAAAPCLRRPAAAGELEEQKGEDAEEEEEEKHVGAKKKPAAVGKRTKRKPAAVDKKPAVVQPNPEKPAVVKPNPEKLDEPSDCEFPQL